MDRKSKHFVLDTDMKVIIDTLTNEEAGQLFKALFTYVTNGKEPNLSPRLALAFAVIEKYL